MHLYALQLNQYFLKFSKKKINSSQQKNIPNSNFMSYCDTSMY